MTRLLRPILCWLAVFLVVTPAAAERLVSQVSNDSIEVTSGFDGERLTLFGTIEPDIGLSGEPIAGPFNIIIVVTGPTQDRVVREKTNNWGLWLNTEQVEYAGSPSYFQVLSSARLADLADPATLSASGITPESQLHAVGNVVPVKGRAFGAQLLRQMTDAGLYGVQENGVGFLSNTFYSARLELPSNAPPGPYIAQTYLLKNGAVIARSAVGFAVRKVGFERFMSLASIQSPLIYGMACVALALLTGWLGGVAFKR